MKTDLERLWRLLFETVERLRNLHHRSLPHDCPQEITLSQMRVLSCVFFSPTGGVRVKDIAQELGITPGGVSQLVDKLVVAGLLVRETDAENRRAVSIRLSQQGMENRTRIEASLNALFGRLLKDISVDKRQIFCDVLESMQNAIDLEKGEQQ